MDMDTVIFAIIYMYLYMNIIHIQYTCIYNVMYIVYMQCPTAAVQIGSHYTAEAKRGVHIKENSHVYGTEHAMYNVNVNTKKNVHVRNERFFIIIIEKQLHGFKLWFIKK